MAKDDDDNKTAYKTRNNDKAKSDDKTADDPQKQKNDQLLAEYERLSAQGFSKEQAAQQLSAKHARTVADITAILDQSESGKK